MLTVTEVAKQFGRTALPCLSAVASPCSLGAIALCNKLFFCRSMVNRKNYVIPIYKRERQAN